MTTKHTIIMSTLSRLALGILILLAPWVATVTAADPIAFRPFFHFKPAPEISVAADEVIPAASLDGEIVAYVHSGAIVFANRDLQEKARVSIDFRPFRMHFTADASRLLVGDESGRLHCVDRKKRRVLWTQSIDTARVGGIAVSPDKKLIAAGGSKKISLLAYKDGSLRGSVPTGGSELTNRGNRIASPHFVSKGKYLAVLEKDEIHFHPLTRGKGFRKGAKVRVVQLKTVISAMPVGNDLYASSHDNLYRVSATRGKPKVIGDGKYTRMAYYMYLYGKNRIAINKANDLLVIANLRRPSSVFWFTHRLGEYSTFSAAGPSVLRVAGKRLGRYYVPPVDEPLALMADQIRSHVPRNISFNHDGDLRIVSRSTSEKAYSRSGGRLQSDPFGPFFYRESVYDAKKNQMESLWEKVECYGPVVVGPTRIIGRVKGQREVQIVERESGKSSRVRLGSGHPTRVTANGRYVTLTSAKTPTAHSIWDTRTKKRLGKWSAAKSNLLAATGDGYRILRVEKTGKTAALLCESPKGKLFWKKPLPATATGIDLSPDDKLVLAASAVFTVKDGEELYRVTGAARFTPDGAHLLVNSSTKKPAHVLRAATGKPYAVLPESPHPVRIVGLGPKQKWMIVAEKRPRRSAEVCWIATPAK